jgi:hypothetical protein
MTVRLSFLLITLFLSSITECIAKVQCIVPQLQAGMTYSLARTIVVNAGFSGGMRLGGYKLTDEKVQTECHGDLALCNKYPEIETCSADGFCRMQFEDARRHKLTIITFGDTRAVKHASFECGGRAYDLIQRSAQPLETPPIPPSSAYAPARNQTTQASPLAAQDHAQERAEQSVRSIAQGPDEVVQALAQIDGGGWGDILPFEPTSTMKHFFSASFVDHWAAVMKFKRCDVWDGDPLTASQGSSGMRIDNLWIHLSDENSAEVLVQYTETIEQRYIHSDNLAKFDMVKEDKEWKVNEITVLARPDEKNKSIQTMIPIHATIKGMVEHGC